VSVGGDIAVGVLAGDPVLDVDGDGGRHLLLLSVVAVACFVPEEVVLWLFQSEGEVFRLLDDSDEVEAVVVSSSKTRASRRRGSLYILHSLPAVVQWYWRAEDVHDYICILTGPDVSSRVVLTRFSHRSSIAQCLGSQRRPVLCLMVTSLAEKMQTRRVIGLGCTFLLADGHVGHHLRSAPRFCMKWIFRLGFGLFCATRGCDGPH
jgi:hypothetical protein